MILIPILFIITLPIIGWVAYYISVSVYGSLKKKDNQYARTIQVFTALIIFAVLLALIGFFIVSSISLER